MKTQHTPGPWLTPGTDGDAYIISHIDTKGKQRTLAHVYNKADARLIAAAPDLLEALQNLVIRYLEAPGSYTPQGAAARAAIAEAVQS